MKIEKEDMDARKALIIVLLVATIIGVFVIVKRQMELENKNKQMSDDIRRLLQFQIEQSQETDKLKRSIINLMSYYKDKDQNVFGELNDALDSLKNEKEADAARAIVVAVETTLKKIAKSEFNEWYLSFAKPEKISLWNLIEKFKSAGIFNEEEFQLASICTPFRNKKSHNAGVEQSTSYNVKMLHVHAGLTLLFKCKEMELAKAS